MTAPDPFHTPPPENDERCGGSGTIPNEVEGLPAVICPGCPDCAPDEKRAADASE